MENVIANEVIFAARPRLARRIWLLRLGAALLFGVTVVGFFLAIYSRADMMRLQATTTLPSLFAIGLLFSAHGAARTPRLIQLSQAGVKLTYPKRETLIPWAEIAMERIANAAITHQRRLQLFGNDGRKLASISDEIEDFDWMTSAIKAQIAQSGNQNSHSVRLSKAKRTGTFAIIGGCVAIALGVVNGYNVYTDQQNEHLLQTQGVEGNATVVRKFVAPDGVTHRIEYKVEEPNGKSATNNVEVDKLIWEIFREGQPVPIMHVPGRPAVSHLVIGELNDPMKSSSRTGWLLCAAIGLLGIFFIVMGIFSRRGIDLTWDSTTNKFKVTRIGAPPVPPNG